MSILKKTLGLGAAATLSFFAWAVRAGEPESVFGLILGEPLALPDCESSVVAGVKFYEPVAKATCVEEAKPLAGYGQPVRRVNFNPKQAPPYMKHWRVFPLETDGKLIGVHFLTPGVSAQEVVFDALKAKYGKPSSVQRIAVQNGFGAVFESLEAEWLLPSVQVKFYGTVGKISTGEVFIDLPEAASLRKTWGDADQSGQVKM
jgi:hypothetical protein